MNRTSYEIQNALRHAIDESATVRCVTGEVPLSPFLAGSFDLHRGEVLGTTVLFAEGTAGAAESLKRLDALEKAVGEPVAVYLPSATASQKRALAAERRGFATGQGDLYLPQFAILLKAAASKKPISTRRFSPAQQQAFIYCLLGDEPLTQEGLRNACGMSAASASRALSSLSDEGLIDYGIGGKTGRKREYRVPDRVEFFRRGRRLFGDPIRSIERGRCLHRGCLPLSGLSALAQRSDLVPTPSTIVAVGPNTNTEDAIEADAFEGDCILQKLSYDPTPFARNGMVDPFTMLMTIDEDDERISMALRKALGECSWYED